VRWWRLYKISVVQAMNLKSDPLERGQALLSRRYAEHLSIYYGIVLLALGRTIEPLVKASRQCHSIVK